MGKDGDQTYVTELFNLDVIISVGYRVKSKRGTQFRIWANSVLKEYLIQGYAVRNGLVQQRYNDLKALVDVMGRTMGYLDSPADDQILPSRRKRRCCSTLSSRITHSPMVIRG